MVISAHHINNVLRVYGEQLRQSMISNRPKSTDTNTPERISISAKTRRETIIDNIISNIIEKEVFKKLECKYGNHVITNKDHHNKLIFKEIDGNGETINSLSIEDSKFLTNKLVIKHEEK
jgi:hypothetical protein